MDKREWNEEQLEEWLKQMPKINDNRNPEDIYQHISEKLNKQKRNSPRLVPVLASVAAIILFFWFVPTDFNSNRDLSNDSSQDSIGLDKEDTVSLKMGQDQDEKREQSGKAEDDNQSNQSKSTEPTEQFDLMLATETAKTAVYQEDLVNSDVITYGIPNAMDDGFIVPVSVLVKKENALGWFEQYMEIMPRLTEEQWGLSEYYPLDGNLTFDLAKNAVNYDLPTTESLHNYSEEDGAALVQALTTTFRGRKEVNKITLTTSLKPGISFGKDTIKEIDLTQMKNSRKPYLLLYKENKSQPLFVPTKESVATMEDAFAIMQKEHTNEGLTASIPTDFHFDRLSASDRRLTIFLSNQFNIPQTPEAIYAIEAILLSAKEFGYSTVEFKHDKIEKIGSFLFNQPIEVPIAANKYEIE